MYLLNVVYSRTFKDIGALIGRDPGSVAHGCAIIESRRDSAIFEEFVSGLEAHLAPAIAIAEEEIESAGPRYA
jgi:hypothetical protein